MLRSATGLWVVVLGLSGCVDAEKVRMRGELDALKRENRALQVERADRDGQLQALHDELRGERAARDAVAVTQAIYVSEEQPQAMLALAVEAYQDGRYEEAVELAQRVLADEPLKAGRIIGAAQCFLKDRRAARKAYARLDHSGQQFLRYVCSRNDIRL